MNNEHETLMAQYLLGDLPEEDKLRFEEEFFKDDAAFEQLTALEDELAYDYARGTLSDSQRKQFEQRFLRTPLESRRVALAQSILETIGEVSTQRHSEVKTPAPVKAGIFWSIANFFKLQGSGLQVGLAAACLLLLFGGTWLLYQTANLRRQVDKLEVARIEQEQQRTQLEQLANDQRRNTEKLSAELENERRQRAELQAEVERQKKNGASLSESPAQLAIPSFLLLPGLTRDINSPPRISLPAANSPIRIQLKLKRPGAYRRYQLILQDLDGKNLWQRTTTAPIASVPTKLIPPGDYVLLLKAKSTGGQWVELDEYHFTTTR